MHIFVASDHTGFALKGDILALLKEKGHEVVDCGAFIYDENDDYPDFVTPCAKKVASTPGSLGIVIGASGQGEAMVANKVPGARAMVYYGEAKKKQLDQSAKEFSLLESGRAHNNANILSLGARFLDVPEALSAVRIFLETPFDTHPRHQRRLDKFP